MFTTMFLSSQKASMRLAVRAFVSSTTTTSVKPITRTLGNGGLVSAGLLIDHRNGARCVSTQRKSAVEEDLDNALENILGEVFEDAGTPRMNNGKSKKPATKSSSLKFAKVIEDAAPRFDFRDPKFLSITNPRWIEAGLSPAVIDALSEKGITRFTPVQGEAFDPVLAGRDVIGQSRTGTGKTLAFGLPALTRLVDITIAKGTRDAATGRMERGRLTSMVILCPTRELARQVQEELSQVARPLGLFVEVFHGGVSYAPQTKAIRQGIDVLVGTPGRVMDHMNRGNLDLAEVNVVVLDEADEMLNMGFAEDVEIILKGVGSANNDKTQCLLFSATAPPWVKDIGRQYQKNVLAIDSTGNEGGARTATTVKHTALQLPPGADKRAILEDIIAVEISRAVAPDDDDDEEAADENPIAAAAAEKKRKSSSFMQRKIFGKTIVFTETKREADELVSGNVFKSLTAQALHGDVGQKQRDSILNAFRSGAFNVLVATDVAARGIDIQDVDLVVQLDPPRDVNTYVHRSGRTGRAGQKGKSLLLFNTKQAKDIVRIERDLGHGFKFDLVGPPSMEAALHAAAKTSSIACKSIPNEIADYFREAAASLLADDESPEDVVARCLAAISRRSTEIQSRSLITGELGMATVEMTNFRGKPISANDVMFTVSKLARMSKRDEDLSFESDLGKIQVNPESGVAVFDMNAPDANKLIEFSKENDASGFVFTMLKELEVERGLHFGKSMDRGRSGGKFDDRNGGRGSGVFRGAGRFESREPQRGYRSNENNYHGGNHRSDHEFRRPNGGGRDGPPSRRPSTEGASRSRRFTSDRNGSEGW